MVHASANNPRLTDEHDYDDGPDMGFLKIHDGIRRLLEIAPATQAWIFAIYPLLLTLKPSQLRQLDDPRPILERWRAANGTKAEGFFTALRLNEEFACYLAALYGRKLAKKNAVSRLKASPHRPAPGGQCNHQLVEEMA